MPILHLVVAITIGLFVPQECPEWQSCRDLAAAAAAREDYETFHDLAWRAVQKGPKNDPALMLTLARAQALSGRPADALVMLERLARMGLPTDAASDPDFRRVRALPGWANVGALVAATPPVTSAASATRTPPAAGPAPAPSARARSSAEPAEALRFAASGLTPDSLAYDGVSRRFLIADRHARKLAVVDEFSQHVATLAGAQAAFGDIEALEIDSRAGDLWVVSSEPAAAGGATTLHKLQLISGRVLATFGVPPQFAPARFIDVAVANGGTVLVLDAHGRVLRLARGALELVAPAPTSATSLAPTHDGTAYLSTADGLMRVDLAARTVLPVAPPAGADLTGLTRVRWHRGSLVGIQRSGDGARVVRIRLARGGRAVAAIESLDTINHPTGAFTISGSTLYYFASKGAGEVVLKKVPL